MKFTMDKNNLGISLSPTVARDMKEHYLHHLKYTFIKQPISVSDQVIDKPANPRSSGYYVDISNHKLDKIWREFYVNKRARLAKCKWCGRKFKLDARQNVSVEQSFTTSMKNHFEKCRAARSSGRGQGWSEFVTANFVVDPNTGWATCKKCPTNFKVKDNKTTSTPLMRRHFAQHKLDDQLKMNVKTTNIPNLNGAAGNTNLTHSNISVPVEDSNNPPCLPNGQTKQGIDSANKDNNEKIEENQVLLLPPGVLSFTCNFCCLKFPSLDAKKAHWGKCEFRVKKPLAEVQVMSTNHPNVAKKKMDFDQFWKNRFENKKAVQVQPFISNQYEIKGTKVFCKLCQADFESISDYKLHFKNGDCAKKLADLQKEFLVNKRSAEVKEDNWAVKDIPKKRKLLNQIPNALNKDKIPENDIKGGNIFCKLCQEDFASILNYKFHFKNGACAQKIADLQQEILVNKPSEKVIKDKATVAKRGNLIKHFHQTSKRHFKNGACGRKIAGSVNEIVTVIDIENETANQEEVIEIQDGQDQTPEILIDSVETKISETEKLQSVNNNHVTKKKRSAESNAEASTKLAREIIDNYLGKEQPIEITIED